MAEEVAPAAAGSFVMGQYNQANALWAPADDCAGVELYLNGMQNDKWCLFGYCLMSSWDGGEAPASPTDGYRMTLSFAETKVEALEGNIEAACIQSQWAGATVCGGITFRSGYGEIVDGQAWGRFVPNAEIAGNVLQGIQSPGWFNTGSAELPNSGGQAFSVGRYQPTWGTSGFLGRNYNWNDYNQDLRVETQDETLSAFYYTYDADAIESRFEQKWTGMLLGASHLAIGASAIVASMLAF